MLEYLTSSYDFVLPKHLIATYPASPRESAKLLVYSRKTDTITHTIFSNILEFIPKDTSIIFNDTKVIKARLFGNKTSGAKCELLINKPLDAYNIEVFIRGRVKESSILLFDNFLQVKVLKLNCDGSRVVQFYVEDKALRFEELLPLLEKIGHMPLPPYIQRDDELEDVIEYQSVFAKKDGAVAAPTASLHFSDELFEQTLSNFKSAFVTLHIGGGTFKPVEVDDIREHLMHSEYFELSKKSIEIIESKEPLLCVGTTSTRVVEFYVRNKNLTAGEANLFLHPQNRPLRVNHLLTNFHLPKSTLLMLVASFVGLEKTKKLYADAIEHNYRFYSYGDAMLIL